MSDENVSAEDIGTEHDPTLIRIPSSGGKSLSQIEKDTDKVIEKNTGKFIKILASEITTIKRLLKEYTKTSNYDTIEDVYQRVHDLRGQGTLFGYPLVTEIGGLFCTYINSLSEVEKPRKEVVVCFLQSMMLAQSQDIKGAATGQMAELLALMKAMVDKFVKK